jgi:hypothetical protein
VLEPDNFWEPVRADLGARGHFDEVAWSGSPALWLNKHRVLLGTAALAGVAALARVFLGNSSRSLFA